MSILGERKEEAFMVESQYEPVMTKGYEQLFPDVQDKVFIPESAAPYVPAGQKKQQIGGIGDDNRSLLIPSLTARLHPLDYTLEIKGIGSRSPMYGFSNIDFMNSTARHKGTTIMEHWSQKAYGSPMFTGEMWFGFSPYGAQGVAASVDSVKISEHAAEEGNPQCLNGFWICPVISYCQLPDWLVDEFSGNYWYRKYTGDWFQQKRLMPSDIRLYFHSDTTIGTSPQKVFGAFGIETEEKLDVFLNNFIASGLATLTLGIRTVRKYNGGYELMDYDDVWLDKDSVIAPNGLIHFADIDDLEWWRYPDKDSARFKLRKQFERNYFEFMFGLDNILSEIDRMFDRKPTVAVRRKELASKMEMAVMGDDFIKSEMSNSGLDLILKPLDAGLEDIPIRVVDFDNHKKVRT